MPAAPRVPFPLLSLPLVLGLSACAVAAGPGVEWRLMVKTSSAVAADPVAVARRASETAGMPVRHLAAAAPDWHSLQLRCPDDSACREAFARLQADTHDFLAVERDERRRAHASSSPS